MATIRDVAREARVSVASASRALNAHHNVSLQIRTRVEAAAGKLDYVPHRGARGGRGAPAPRRRATRKRSPGSRAATCAVGASIRAARCGWRAR